MCACINTQLFNILLYMCFHVYTCTCKSLCTCCIISVLYCTVLYSSRYMYSTCTVLICSCLLNCTLYIYEDGNVRCSLVWWLHTVHWCIVYLSHKCIVVHFIYEIWSLKSLKPIMFNSANIFVYPTNDELMYYDVTLVACVAVSLPNLSMFVKPYF